MPFRLQTMKITITGNSKPNSFIQLVDTTLTKNYTISQNIFSTTSKYSFDATLIKNYAISFIPGCETKTICSTKLGEHIMFFELKTWNPLYNEI